ncbi:hypothetical protein SEA_GODPHATHER_42 [Mycobacterium phage GodPhather]|uniref:Uncharacterized protein n=1 Tax=Mycobacterium phage Jeon TaxID=2108123 RepID=A0A2P1JRH9_9CAUD|nr:hypothetical protein PQB70_gp41 [Mycobacterium phage Jeon]AVO21744.1 hypothetical protein SEA_JEON_41 [Mycobacterium phage Jeon]QBP32615.1 hypothetical protein SEA_GODPHATHER_42 [Mycobacterium phage GodPhather]
MALSDDQDDDEPLKCPGCGEEARGVWIDVGAGFTEYWGAVSYDKQMVYVSECCEAALPEPERREE